MFRARKTGFWTGSSADRRVLATVPITHTPRGSAAAARAGAQRPAALGRCSGTGSVPATDAATHSRRGVVTAETSQTLDRGLRVLKLLADTDHGLTVTELSHKLGVNRTVVYRLLATLEQHAL